MGTFGTVCRVTGQKEEKEEKEKEEKEEKREKENCCVRTGRRLYKRSSRT